MEFIWPSFLILLVLVPLLAWLYFRMEQRRRRFSTEVSGLNLGQESWNTRPGGRRHLPMVLFLAGLAILIVALARPQTVVSLPQQEGTVILAFDVSGSMAADDLQPSRMEAAKTAARTFVERQPASVQVGVVVFSDSGFTVQTPTNDQAAILASIDRLTPQRGTSLAYGILISLNTIASIGAQGPNQYSNITPEPTATPTPVPKGTYEPAAIILLTDGENNIPPDPLEAAQLAADRGVKVYTVGIGSPAGATINIDGFNVLTQLNEGMLTQIAQITGGAYYNAENEQELQAIYDQIEPELRIRPKKMEVTSIFAGASILALLLGGTFSLLWFNRLP
jgi:Ca-activated chloride channel family protein